MSHVLVLLSGGQDSATLLCDALAAGYERVEALAINYGQRHDIELSCAQTIARELGVALEVNHLPPLGMDGDVVLHRNAILLSLAVSRAMSRGFDQVLIGACLDDATIYHDCRAAFVDAYNAMIAAQNINVTVRAPLVGMTKAQVWSLARDLGVLDLIIEHTHTCYRGDRSIRHAWGYGCGECGSCRLRERSWHQSTLTQKEIK